MADKTDMVKLIECAESFCLRYRAFAQIAKANDLRWAVPLNRYKEANRESNAKRFDALLAAAQKNPNSTDVIRGLTDLLEETLVSE